jgi:hypothetical protein
MPVKRLCVLGGAAAVLFVALVAVHSIPAQPDPGIPPRATPPPPGAPAVPSPHSDFVRPAADRKAEIEEPTIDELIRKLASIKEQKAALEQAEKKTVALLKEKLKQQKDTLEKLGVGSEGGEKARDFPVSPPSTSAPPSPLGGSGLPLTGSRSEFALPR